MEIKGIKYIGPILDGSGYAKACRENIKALLSIGVNLTLSPISFETIRPNLEGEGKELNKLINKSIDYNIVIIHTTPEFWEKYREDDKMNLGYTIWETTKLHPAWKDYINNNVEKVLVGCDWNVDVFKESGIKLPIGVIPHPINIPSEQIKPYNINGVSEDTYMFYSIYQWCYDDKTRVLTEDGFKYFKELNYDDKIATLNPITENLEYYKSEKIVSFRRKDKMFSLQGNFFDICVTPDHKMVVKDKSNMNVPWELIPFNNLVSKDVNGNLIVKEKYRTKKDCNWIGKEETIFKIPMLDDNRYSIKKNTPTEISMDIFLEFLGWYLSEGSTYKGKNCYVTTITQYDLKNRKEIIMCIEKMGFNPIEKNDKDIIFNSRELYYYLKQFGKSNVKFIPKWIKNLSSRQIKILLLSLFKGDGSFNKKGEFAKYVSTSKHLAEDVLECLLKIKMSGAISISDPTLKKPGQIDGRYIHGKLLQYTVSVNKKRNEPSMYYADLKEIDYDGYVHCVTVPNHTMLVERNGKIIFSGNTERKNPVSSLKAYWYAFQNNEDVALVLKTYRSDYSEQEKDAIRRTINRLKDIMPMDVYPKISLIPNLLTDNEIHGLHSRGDCYVSTDRGEGFGLSGAAAGSFGKPIIVTGFGGALEYAKEDNSYLIDYHLTPVFGMPWCISINSLINTNKGYINVDSLDNEEIIFNGAGELSTIKKIESRPLNDNEYMISFKAYSMIDPIEITNNHKLLVVNSSNGNIEKIKAENINVGDYLITPKLVLNESKEINYDEDLFYLIGLYLAEGYTNKNKTNVCFSFHLLEKNTLGKKCKDIVKNIFNLLDDNIYERELTDRNGYEICFNDKKLSNFFSSTFGTGSNKKKIPYEYKFAYNKECREALLRGYWDGDGHISYRFKNIEQDKKRMSPECVAETVSKFLAMDLRDLLISLDIIPSIRSSKRDNKQTSYILSVSSIEFDHIFNIENTKRIKSKYKYKINDTMYAVMVTKKELLEDYTDVVYSISVKSKNEFDFNDDNGTYILGGISSSNSPWYKGEQLWAETNVHHTSQLLRHVYKNQEEAKQKGSKLQQFIKDNLSYEVIGNKIIKEIEMI